MCTATRMEGKNIAGPRRKSRTLTTAWPLAALALAGILGGRGTAFGDDRVSDTEGRITMLAGTLTLTPNGTEILPAQPEPSAGSPWVLTVTSDDLPNPRPGDSPETPDTIQELWGPWSRIRNQWTVSPLMFCPASSGCKEIAPP
jgi:hypothetical protein